MDFNKKENKNNLFDLNDSSLQDSKLENKQESSEIDIDTYNEDDEGKETDEEDGVDEEDDGDQIYKDAIFLSPHKFIGGPRTPGILIAKKHLFTNRTETSNALSPEPFSPRGDHTY